MGRALRKPGGKERRVWLVCGCQGAWVGEGPWRGLQKHCVLPVDPLPAVAGLITLTGFRWLHRVVEEAEDRCQGGLGGPWGVVVKWEPGLR